MNMVNRLSVTGLVAAMHCYDSNFWASYKAMEKLMEKERFAEVKMGFLKIKKILDKYIAEVGVEEFEKAKAEILEEWKVKSDEAKASGTATHKAIEEQLSTNRDSFAKSFGISNYPVGQIDQFLTTDKGLFPEFKMELNIGDNTLVGVADLVVKNENHISIIDWKDAEKISFKGRFDTGRMKTKNMRYPLNALPDVSGVHYQLQLSIYAWMLQQLNPDFIIDKLEIMQVRDMKLVGVYPVEYLKPQVEKLINFYINDLKLKQELEKCKPVEL